MSNRLGAVCTTPMCKDGRAALATAWGTFHYLEANYSNFNAASFQPALQGLQASLDSVDSWYADLIPFNPTCCTIDSIGQQATVLAGQMTASVGAVNVPIPKPPATPQDWAQTAVIAGAILLLVVYSPQIKKALQ